MIFLNVKSISRLTDAKTGATRIATNILENINASYYDEIKNFDSTAEGAQQSIFNTKLLYFILQIVYNLYLNMPIFIV